MKKKHYKQKGIMIIEMMVGVMIAMFSVLAIYSLYANFEAQKRTTVNTGSALQNGSLAIFQLEHDGKMSGYGINNVDLIGCNVRTWDETTNASFDFVLAPANITFGSNANTPDAITFTMGSSDNAFNSLKIMSNQISPTSVFKVENRYGMKTGELLVVGEPAKDCSLVQVSNLPNIVGLTDNIVRDSGTYVDPVSGTVVATRFNKPTGLGVTYSIQARLTNMGAEPTIRRYSVTNNQLIFRNVLGTNNPTIPVVDQIVHMRAIYGKDVDADNTIDTWNRVVPTTGAEWAQVISLRVAVVARSGQRERPDSVTGLCNITTNSTITWNSGVTGTSSNMDISGLPDWQCYRYRVMHTTIPLRNMIWNSKS